MMFNATFNNISVLSSRGGQFIGRGHRSTRRNPPTTIRSRLQRPRPPILIDIQHVQ